MSGRLPDLRVQIAIAVNTRYEVIVKRKPVRGRAYTFATISGWRPAAPHTYSSATGRVRSMGPWRWRTIVKRRAVQLGEVTFAEAVADAMARALRPNEELARAAAAFVLLNVQEAPRE